MNHADQTGEKKMASSGVKKVPGPLKKMKVGVMLTGKFSSKVLVGSQQQQKRKFQQENSLGEPESSPPSSTASSSSSSSSSDSPTPPKTTRKGFSYTKDLTSHKPVKPVIIVPPLPPISGPPVPASVVAQSILPFDWHTPAGSALAASVANNEVILRRVLHFLSLSKALRLAEVNRAFRAARSSICANQRRLIVLAGSLASVAFLHYHKRESELIDESTKKPLAVDYPQAADYASHGMRILSLLDSSVSLTRAGMFRNLTELSIAESPIILWPHSPLFSWLTDLRHTLISFRLRLSNLNNLYPVAPYINRLSALQHLTLLNINFDFDLLERPLMGRLRSLTANIDQFSGDFAGWMETIAQQQEAKGWNPAAAEQDSPSLKIHMSKFTGPLYLQNWEYFVGVPQAAAACFTAIPLMVAIPLARLKSLALAYTHLTDLELNHPTGSLPDIIAAIEPLTKLTFLTLQIISPTIEYPNQPFHYGNGKYPPLRRLPSVRWLKLAFSVKVHVDLTAWQLHSTFPGATSATLSMTKYPCTECARRNISSTTCLRNGVRWAQKRWSHVPKLTFRIAHAFPSGPNRQAYYEVTLDD